MVSMFSVIPFLFLLSGVAGSEVCTDVHPSSSTQNRRYTGDVLTSVSVVGLQQCRTMCRNRRDCRGINYNRRQLSCQLMSNSTSYDPNLLTSDSDYTFYTDTEHESEAEVPQTCQKETCPENQVCVTLTSGQSSCQVVDGAVCVATGFTYNGRLNMCTLVVSAMTNWTDANTLCGTYRNGRLVVLDTAEKSTYMRAMLQDITAYWVGAKRDTVGSNEFSWLTSERVDPPPYSSTEYEMCMAAINGEFHDYPCYVATENICEWYVNDVLSIKNKKFADHVDCIYMYPSELEIKDTTDSSTSAAYPDLYLNYDKC